MAKVTARDVGRLAGVHQSTVSRVLNRTFDRHSFDPQTIRRIEESALKLGYRPSHAARSLRSGKTMQVGVVVPDIANPFFGEIAASIERHVRERGYRTLICNTEENPRLQNEHLAELAARRVDGIILCPSGLAGCDRVLDAGVPLVSMDRAVSMADIPHIGLNNARAGHMLGEHLRRQDYHRIGAVMPEIPHDPTLLERLRGLMDGLGAEGQLVWTESSSLEQLRTHARQRVAHRLRHDSLLPDAMVGLTNHSTLSIIEAMYDANMYVAEPIGVAGIDDFSAATITRPGITAVTQPVGRIAVRAAAHLLALMAGEAVPAKSTLLDPVLIARGSLRDAPNDQPPTF